MTDSEHTTNGSAPEEANGKASKALEPHEKAVVLGVVTEGAPEANLNAVKRNELTWDKEGKHWRNKRDQRICGAHPKKDRGPCRAYSLYKNGRCKNHGGLTPSGVASPHYKHGRFAGALNEKRRQQYLEAKDNPDQMDLGRPLALLEVQVTEAVGRREDLDTPEFRQRAQALYKKARRQLKARQNVEAGITLKELGDLLERGVEEDRAREEVGRTTSRLARHMEAAWKVRLGAAAAINAADLTVIMGAFVEVAHDEMEPEQLRRFLGRVDREVLSGMLTKAGVTVGNREEEEDE